MKARKSGINSLWRKRQKLVDAAIRPDGEFFEVLVSHFAGSGVEVGGRVDLNQSMTLLAFSWR
ncbi:hypothetical protein [Nitrosomonas sp.]|uniref:hypothetical protein n=1 Tax=Nitrosomonas sp. TaxID=42353 RepID=UPI00260A45B8|nr:hypothetical protein [Nitrosomonas sp.]MCW5601867.1 hypothetical protein [Nitrosomonas sp.]